MNEITEAKKHELCMEALRAKGDLELGYLDFCRMLYDIKEQRLYEAGWSSWEEYKMELKMDESKISRCLRVHETFILRFHIKPALLAQAGGWTVLADILPSIDQETTKEAVLDLVEKAGTQTRTDLRRTLKEAKTGISMTHKHTEKPYYLRIYNCCGLRERLEDAP